MRLNRHNIKTHTALRGLLASLCLLISCEALALQKSITVISDHQTQYHSIISSIRQYANKLENTPELFVYRSSDKLKVSKTLQDKNTCIISIGLLAFSKISRAKHPPVCSISLLISKSQFYSSSPEFQSRASAVFINQPLNRISNVLQRTLKQAERASIVISSQWPEELNLKQAKLDLYIKNLPVGGSIIQAFRQASKNTDFVIALPDAHIYNRHNIKSILLTTYKAKVPLIGYSEALSRAGALISIYTPPHFLAKQAIEWFSQGQKRVAGEPKYFQVKLNKKVSQSLRVDIKNEALFSKDVWVDNHE